MGCVTDGEGGEVDGAGEFVGEGEAGVGDGDSDRDGDDEVGDRDGDGDRDFEREGAGDRDGDSAHVGAVDAAGVAGLAGPAIVCVGVGDGHNPVGPGQNRTNPLDDDDVPAAGDRARSSVRLASLDPGEPGVGRLAAAATGPV